MQVHAVSIYYLVIAIIAMSKVYLSPPKVWCLHSFLIIYSIIFSCLY